MCISGARRAAIGHICVHLGPGARLYDPYVYIWGQARGYVTHMCNMRKRTAAAAAAAAAGARAVSGVRETHVPVRPRACRTVTGRDLST
jgi:hypothetical protein